MKYNKVLFIVSLLAGSVGFTACDNEDEYVPGAPAGEYNVGFDTEENVILGLQETELTVEVTRDNTEGELVVPLQPVTVPGFMTVPESVTFADGSATTTLTVTLGEGMKPFNVYRLCVKIPNKYNTFYYEDSKCPTLSLAVQKEDYKVVAVGEYDSEVLNEESWEQELEYSAYLNLYRIPNWAGTGTNWYFTFDGQDDFQFSDKDGNPVKKFLCGDSYSNGEGIVANVVPDVFMGYKEGGPEGVEGYFLFPLEYNISLGTFGSGYEFLYITEWIEKPWETQAGE